MSKVTKKSLAILIIAILLSSLIPNLISNAETTPEIAITDSNTGATSASANVGETVSVNFKLVKGEENSTEGQFYVKLEYDGEYLEAVTKYKDEDGTGDYSDFLSTSIFSKNGNQNYVFGKSGTTVSGSQGIGFIYVNGYTEEGASFNSSADLGTLNFKILKSGTTSIKVTAVGYGDNDDDVDSSTVICSFDITGKQAMTGLESTAVTKTLKVGSTTQVSATKTPTDTTDTTAITYTSSNTAVATVDSTGKVTAVANGTAEITATCGSYSAKCGTITVVTPLTSVTLDKTSVELHRDSATTAQLTPSVNSGVSEAVEYSYASSDTSVATVDSTGKITAVGNGTATITVTATSKDPVDESTTITKTATCKVTVDTPLSGLKLESSETLAFEIGEDATSTATQAMVVSKNPTDTTDTAAITYSSADESIATVDSNGNVTAKAKGETTITATCGSKTVTCKVVVTMPVTGVTIKEGDSLELKCTQSQDLTAEISPSGAADISALKWSVASSTPVNDGDTVVTVENGTVKAVNPGTAVVRVTYLANDKIYDEITITVPEVKATELIINKNTTSIEKGESETLTASLLPTDTTDKLNVTWTSSDESIATVDSTGKVTAVAPGKTTITATMGSLTATCDVTVTCALQSISLDKESVNLVIDGSTIPTETLTVSKNPTDADPSLDDVTWSSSATTVATVDSNGVVTAVAPGTTYITATLDGKTAQCKVVVDKKLTSVSIENEDTNLTLYKNKTGVVKPVLTPSDATLVPTPTWTSSDETVATVDSNGTVTALKEGTTKITVTYTQDDGTSLTASRTVEVKEVKATGVTITQKPESILKNEESTLEYTVTKDDETQELTDEIYWSSSDTSIAYVVLNSDGTYKVVGAGEGTATITLKVGSVEDSFEVAVSEIHISSLKAEMDGTTVTEGEQAKINVTVNPTNSTDSQNFTYTVANESVAKVVVDKNGVAYVKGVNAGTTVVTVTAENGVKTSFEVTVAAATNTSSSSGGSSSGGGSSVATTVSSLVGSPHTGDMNVAALAIMAIVSFGGMVFIVKKK